MIKLILLFILLFPQICWSAQGYKTKYNPHTGKQDFVVDVSSLEVGNISATGTITGVVVSATNALQVGSDYITDITGTGLSVVGGKLTAGGSESTTVSDTTTINLTLTGTDITADSLHTAGDNLTLTGADFDLDQSISLTNVTASGTVTGVVVDTQYLENSVGGAVSVRDAISMNNYLINNLATPVSSNDAVTKDYVDNAIGIEIDYFFNDTASDLGGIYYAMTDGDLGGVESTLTKSGLTSGNNQALYSFATPTGGVGLDTLNAGIYNTHFHAEKTAGTRSVTIYAEIYTRTSGGVETLIATSETSSAITTKTGFSLHAVLASDVNLNTTDRLVVKFYANVGASGADVNIALYQEGTTDSHFSVSVNSDTLSNIFIRQDGTKALTADWNSGNYTITTSGIVVTGIADAGGATSFEVPNGSPTVDAAGEVGVDTTSDQFVYYGGAKRVLTFFNEKGFVLEDPVAADDNVPFWHPKQNITITDCYCETEGGTSAEVTISDGTNALETITCDADGQADDGSIANGTFTANERMEFDIGTVTGAVDWVAFTITYTIDAD